MKEHGRESSFTVGEPDPSVSNIVSADQGYLIQLTKHGVTVKTDLEILRQHFSQQHTLRLPQLLHPELIRMILPQLERGSWMPNDHGEIARELLLVSGGASAVLHFAANTPEFLRTIDLITQCGRISVFGGRVYRRVPGTDHYDSWHDDLRDNRLVGMSVNLGSRPYQGGVFQLRRKGSDRILCELPNVVQGDAILFRISPELKHRVTSIEGTEPKTAFAGWFKFGESDFFSDLRQPVNG